MTEEREKEMDWDSDIPLDEGRGEFVTLPEGTEATFEVKKFDKDRSQAGAPMAKLELICTDGEKRRAYVHENLTLSAKAIFRVRKFGVAIGHLRPNEPGRILWDDVIGAKGRCVLGIEQWKRRDGSTAESNRVKEWLPFEAEAGGAEVDFA